LMRSSNLTCPKAIEGIKRERKRKDFMIEFDNV